MNTAEHPVNGPRVVESLMRAAFNNPAKRDAIQKATGWDSTMFGKVQSGTAGITIDKLDAVMRALEFSVVEVEYMNWLAKGNEIGSNCRCARESMGQCGMGR